MADFKRLDYDGVMYLVQYIFNKLATSPLADGTTYTLEQSGADLLLKDGEGTTVVTLSDALVTSEMATKIANIPTDNASLANGAGYQTASDVATAINAALASFTGGIVFEIKADVASLPTEGATGHIYMVPNSSLSGDSYYDEYFWDATNSRYEMFGTTRTNLAGYVKDSEMSKVSNSEIETAVNTAYNTVFGTPTP